MSEEVQKSLTAIDEAIRESKTIKLQIQESTYEIKSFEEEIVAECIKLREKVDSLRTAEYTTCTEESFARIEGFLIESSGATDEMVLQR